MRLLLDTHVFLWWLLNDPRLSARAMSAIMDLSNQLYLSAASGFEIATKVVAGKLRLPTDVPAFILAGMQQGQVQEMPITMRHINQFSQLAPLHRDPFDRLLVATALADNLTLVTADAAITKYPVHAVW